MRLLLRPLVSLAMVAAAVLPTSPTQAQSGNSFAANRQMLLSQSARESFPQLGNRFVVLGHATPRYNCIAHTVGNHSQWVWPGDRITHFNDLYGRHGYRRIRGLDYRRRSDQNKIVLYGRQDRDRVRATHAARQFRRGGWTSKLGQWPLIWHPSVWSVSGPSYGEPIAVYVRRR